MLKFVPYSIALLVVGVITGMNIITVPRDRRIRKLAEAEVAAREAALAA